MKTPLLFLALLYSVTSNAQDMLGVSNGNFAGTTGIALNPASIILMPCKWDVTIISLDLSVEQNFAGMPKKKLFGNPEGTGNEPNGGLNLYYSGGTKSANAHLAFGLPSFAFRFKDM